MERQELRGRTGRRAKITILAWTAFAVTMTVSAILTYAVIIDRCRHDEEDTVTRVQQITQEIGLSIVNTLTFATQDIKLMSESRELQEYLRTGEAEALRSVTDSYVSLSRINPNYDKIRFIDASGKEIIRVNQGQQGPEVVPPEQLQDKSNRYFFVDAMQSTRDETYVSPLDLNVDGDSIEQPIKPTIRLARSVMVDGEVRGIVIINFLATDIFNQFDVSWRKNPSVQMELLNGDGYWLYSSAHPELAWGFMYTDRLLEKMPVTDLSHWQRMTSANQASYRNGDGHHISLGIRPFLAAQRSSSGTPFIFDPNTEETTPSEQVWWIMAIIPNESLGCDMVYVTRVTVTLTVFFLLLGIVVQSFIRLGAMRERLLDRTNRLNGLLAIMNKILRHDLRNHFTSIRYNLEMHRDKPERERIDYAYAAAGAGISLITEMRQLEAEATDGSRLLTPTSLRAVALAVASRFVQTVEVTGDGCAKIDVAFHSVLNNLISNAFKHGAAKRVDIDISTSGDTVIVKVANDGTRIPDDVKSHLFVEGSSYGPNAGTGIGLYIVYDTITRYDGKVSVADGDPQGTVFTIELPNANC